MSKYSIKNISLGIGIGLILASMVNLNMGQRQLTKEEIKIEAERHNLIVLDKNVIEKSKDQLTPTPTTEATPTPTAQAEETQAVTIEIKSGYTSDYVAELLLNKALIADKSTFLSRLEELGKSNKLQIGSFNIKKGSTIDTIIEILTTIPI